jgi:hypothetical protein
VRYGVGAPRVVQASVHVDFRLDFRIRSLRFRDGGESVEFGAVSGFEQNSSGEREDIVCFFGVVDERGRGEAPFATHGSVAEVPLVPGPRVGRARVGAVHVSVASPVAFEAFGHWKISGVREGLDAALEFLQDTAIHHALARVAVGVVEQARGDLTLDGADVPEAFRAHERVASIVLLLDAHARGLAQHALALG